MKVIETNNPGKARALKRKLLTDSLPFLKRGLDKVSGEDPKLEAAIADVFGDIILSTKILDIMIEGQVVLPLKKFKELNAAISKIEKVKNRLVKSLKQYQEDQGNAFDKYLKTFGIKEDELSLEPKPSKQTTPPPPRPKSPSYAGKDLRHNIMQDTLAMFGISPRAGMGLAIGSQIAPSLLGPLFGPMSAAALGGVLGMKALPSLAKLAALPGRTVYRAGQSVVKGLTGRGDEAYYNPMRAVKKRIGSAKDWFFSDPRKRGDDSSVEGVEGVEGVKGPTTQPGSEGGEGVEGLYTQPGGEGLGYNEVTKGLFKFFDEQAYKAKWTRDLIEIFGGKAGAKGSKGVAGVEAEGGFGFGMKAAMGLQVFGMVKKYSIKALKFLVTPAVLAPIFAAASVAFLGYQWKEHLGVKGTKDLLTAPKDILRTRKISRQFADTLEEKSKEKFAAANKALNVLGLDPQKIFRAHDKGEFDLSTLSSDELQALKDYSDSQIYQIPVAASKYARGTKGKKLGDFMKPDYVLEAEYITKHPEFELWRKMSQRLEDKLDDIKGVMEESNNLVSQGNQDDTLAMNEQTAVLKEVGLKVEAGAGGNNAPIKSSFPDNSTDQLNSTGVGK